MATSVAKNGIKTTGTVIANKLNSAEKAFAGVIVAEEGGTLVGQTVKNLPGIDGTLNGVPISLKQTTGGLVAVLRHASVAEVKAANRGYSGVRAFIEAPNVSKAALLDFAKKELAGMPSKGVLSEINVLTRDGWVRFSR
jgi:hypothetical protein